MKMCLSISPHYGSGIEKIRVSINEIGKGQSFVDLPLDRALVLLTQATYDVAIAIARNQAGALDFYKSTDQA